MAFKLLLFAVLLSAVTQVLASSLYEALAHSELSGRADKKKDDRAWKPPKPNGKLSLAQLPDARPKAAERKFSSKLVEDEISRVSARIGDAALKRIFINCYPNSLDTTVDWFDLDLKQPDHAKAFPRSFWITGDIEASWLRDSASQLKPYLPLLERKPTTDEERKEWDKLYRLALGLVYMQSQMVITAPYANSFTPPKSAKLHAPANNIMDQKLADSDWYFPAPPGHKSHYVPQGFKNATTPDVDTDGTGVWEMKFEVDSLANFLGLAPALAKYSGRADFLGSKLWRRATRLALDTLVAQQRSSADERVAFDAKKSSRTKESKLQRRDVKTQDEATDWQKRFEGRGGGVYRFQRLDRSPTETRSDKGYGEPCFHTGMVKSAFRPSDDATIFPFLVPSNAQLATSLAALLPIINAPTNATKDTSPTSLTAIAGLASKLESDVRGAIQEHAVLPRKGVDGEQLAFEVDGYGSASFMDDANVPSLLSLPYLGFMNASDPLYVRTRSTLFSPKNKWWFNGTAGHGIGGPHVGSDYAWPMSRIVQILTTEDEAEQRDALAFLRSTTAGTGLMHESVNVNNATDFTRAWFGWANGLFGEAIRHVEGGANAALLNATYA